MNRTFVFVLLSANRYRYFAECPQWSIRIIEPIKIDRESPKKHD